MMLSLNFKMLLKRTQSTNVSIGEFGMGMKQRDILKPYFYGDWKHDVMN